MKKVFLFLFLASLAGCSFHVEDPHAPCGYYETPFYHEPEVCYNDGCCTWVVDNFYSECLETWCYNQYYCGWQYEEQYCYPI